MDKSGGLQGVIQSLVLEETGRNKPKFVVMGANQADQIFGVWRVAPIVSVRAPAGQRHGVRGLLARIVPSLGTIGELIE